MGELWVKSQVSSAGYLNTNESSDTRDAAGYLNTGDIVRLDAEHGSVSVLDRSKAYIKLANSKWVSPQQVEYELLKVGSRIVGRGICLLHAGARPFAPIEFDGTLKDLLSW
jgi:long-subunit acyl-CoA synthetase (AMP-forming)